MDDEQKLRLFICDLVDIDESDLQKDDALFSSGIIDSFNLLDLVSFVENEWRIKVQPAHMSLDNWDSIQQIIEFIYSQK